MFFAGLQKTSLLDYPSKISAVIFIFGCNFRCRFCHNPEIVLPEKFSGKPIDEAEVWQYLAKRRGIIDGVCVTGGEPLIHLETVDFLQKLKDFGVAVKLDTNGSFPDRLAEIIQKKLVDYIAMDIKSSPENYTKVAGSNAKWLDIKKSIELVMSSSIDYEFRSTVVPSIHDEEEITKMAQAIAGAKRYYLQNFSYGGKIIDESLRAVVPFTELEMKNFQKTASRFVPQTFCR